MNNKLTQRNSKLQSKQKQTWSGIEVFSLVLIIFYLLTEFITNDTKYIDNMHPQWLYLSGLNIISFIFVWNKIRLFYSALNEIRKNLVTLIYLIFIFVLAISIFQAINVFQGFEALSRNITTFFIFLNGSLLLYQIKEKIHVLAKIIVLILLYQSIDILVEFLSNTETISLDTKILSLVEGYGNKNVTSVGLLIKIPFVVFLTDHYRKGIWNIFGLLVLAIAVFDILLLNARASFVGLGLMILVMLFFSIFSYFKIQKDKALLINLSKIIGIIIVIMFANVLYINSLRQSKKVVVGGYGSVTERITTISMSQNSIRNILWDWAFNLFKDNWALGCGAGNYPIAVMKYENKTRNSFAISKHAHNDFLEIAAETGIFGFISYSVIYLFFFINFIKIIIRPGDLRLKKLSVIAFMGLTIYFVDAIFNFPHERPPIQIYFGIILALIVVLSVKSKEQESKLVNEKSLKMTMIPLLAVLGGAIYINATVVESSVAQKLTRSILSVDKQELAPKFRNLKADDLNSKFPDYPTINDAGMPIVCTKAEFLIKEKRFDEALEVLKSAKKANPYHMGDDKLRMNIFQAIEQYDSAMYYANRGLQALPYMSEFCSNIGIMEYEKGNIEAAKKHFEKAISLNSSDYMSYENLGVILYNSKDYPLAIEYLTKVIDSKTSNTGKAELIRGWCYYFSGDKEKGCADYRRSVAKNCTQAVEYLKGCN